jgi:hypothetical protein
MSLESLGSVESISEVYFSKFLYQWIEFQIDLNPILCYLI